MKSFAQFSAGSERAVGSDITRSRAAGRNRALPIAPSSVHQVLQSPGQPLDSTTRRFMEPCFGHDFSRVRIHAESQAAESARSVGALAYTVGNHVVFGEGRHNPNTPAGQKLLAHELAHTVQQSSIENPVSGRLLVGAIHDAFEEEADRAAASIISRGESALLRKDSGPVLRRQPKGEEHTPERVPFEPAGKEHGTAGQKAAPAVVAACKPPSDIKLPCTPQPLANDEFMKISGVPPDALGHTFTLAGTAEPNVTTKPAPQTKGVVLEPIKFVPVPCRSFYVKAGPAFWRRIPLAGDTENIKKAAEQCQGEYRGKVSILPAGEKKIIEAEMEHCTDFKYAFDITLGCYQAAVNDFAKKQTVFDSEQAAFDALAKRVGLHPDQWVKHYVELLEKSKERDRRKWHVPVDLKNQMMFLENEGKEHCRARSTAVVDEKSYPDVGKHRTPDVIQ